MKMIYKMSTLWKKMMSQWRYVFSIRNIADNDQNPWKQVLVRASSALYQQRIDFPPAAETVIWVRNQNSIQ
jgi:hypothetical protein